jgi:hypothetical protein
MAERINLGDNSSNRVVFGFPVVAKLVRTLLGFAKGRLG